MLLDSRLAVAAKRFLNVLVQRNFNQSPFTSSLFRWAIASFSYPQCNHNGLWQARTNPGGFLFIFLTAQKFSKVFLALRSRCGHSVIITPLEMRKPFDSIVRVRIPKSLKERMQVVARRRMIGVGAIVREQMLAYLALNEATPYLPPKSPEPGPANGNDNHGNEQR